MNKEKYYPPEYAEGKFHCPHCNVFAKQRWGHLQAVNNSSTTRFINHYQVSSYSDSLSTDWMVSFCEYCNDLSVWFKEEMIYPKQIDVADPNDDLSEEIKRDYLEAAKVLNDSSRSAAAILRLSLQKLCKQLGEKGENINNDIGELVKKGLNPAIQKSLDTLRITGNNAVHPGELDLTEDKKRVIKLFGLLNFIAEKMITEPREIQAFYDKLPENSKKAIEKRDGSSSGAQKI